MLSEDFHRTSHTRWPSVPTDLPTVLYTPLIPDRIVVLNFYFSWGYWTNLRVVSPFCLVSLASIGFQRNCSQYAKSPNTEPVLTDCSQYAKRRKCGNWAVSLASTGFQRNCSQYAKSPNTESVLTDCSQYAKSRKVEPAFSGCSRYAKWCGWGHWPISLASTEMLLWITLHYSIGYWYEPSIF